MKIKDQGNLLDIYKKSGALHHAYAIQGDKENVMPDLLKFLAEDFGVGIKNNPDFSYQEFETFTIDDGRDLQDRHNRRAIGDKKIFIIVTRFITTEAQNALLKLFEEPTGNTHLFLVMPNTQVLLPTLRSRLVILNYKDDGRDQSASEKDATQLAKKFLVAKPAERIALLKNLIEEKDKAKAIDFVTALEHALAPELTLHAKTTNIAKSLEEILTAKKYLHDRAPSIKLLLEHLSLTIR